MAKTEIRRQPGRLTLQTPEKPWSASAIRRREAFETLGARDRKHPCPHALDSHTEVPDPTRAGRTLLRTTRAVCVRNSSHGRLTGDGGHRTDDGREWR